MDWININEREPKHDERIFAITSKGTVLSGFAYKIGKKWRISYSGGNMVLTKWATYDVEY